MPSEPTIQIEPQVIYLQVDGGVDMMIQVPGEVVLVEVVQQGPPGPPGGVGAIIDGGEF